MRTFSETGRDVLNTSWPGLRWAAKIIVSYAHERSSVRASRGLLPAVPHETWAIDVEVAGCCLVESVIVSWPDCNTKTTQLIRIKLRIDVGIFNFKQITQMPFSVLQ